MSSGAESKDPHTSSALRCLREFSERTWHGGLAIIERLQRQCKLCRGASTPSDLPRKSASQAKQIIPLSMTGVGCVSTRKVIIAAQLGEKLSRGSGRRLLHPRSRDGCPRRLPRSLGAPISNTDRCGLLHYAA